ncbi:MAG: serine--tRNA ligase, partial [Candidatus Thiodiazotropha weberae]|nr:serine--tRNA ligase [Candidatus Thiodiazotropha lotti]MCW4209926.1 serine--tRNA ligase [Candidatus Thiodiazotropha lotti]
MLDPRLIRNNLEEVAAQLRRRGYELDTQLIAELEERRKGLQVESQELQNERNSRSKSIGKAKAAGEDIQPLLAEVAELGDRLKLLQEDLNGVQAELSEITLGIPNIPHETVPDGRDEADNREERRWGEPREFDFEPKDHVDLGDASGLLDFEAAARI